MLTVVYLSILQHKLVFLFQPGTFTDSFSVGVITRSKFNWLPANRTAFTASQQVLILLAVINRTLMHSQSLLSVV